MPRITHQFQTEQRLIMKWFYRLLTIAMLGGALLVPFFINNHEGKPMFSMPEPNDLIPSRLTSNSDASTPSPSNAQTFYKWQDDQGTWHYGDTPPANGPKVSTIEIDSNTNIIQSTPSAPPKVQNQAPNPQVPSTDISSDQPLSNVLSFERAANVLKDAKNVQTLMDNHNAQLESLSNKQ